MKRVLEDELISLAERILKLKNRADIHQLKKETGILYEKLSILAFAELHFGGLKSDISKTEFKEVFSQQFSEIDQETGHYKTPDGMDYNPDPISEPNTEKIKDMVSQMPPESEQVDLLLAELEKLRYQHYSKTKHLQKKKRNPRKKKPLLLILEILKKIIQQKMISKVLEFILTICQILSPSQRIQRSQHQHFMNTIQKNIPFSLLLRNQYENQSPPHQMGSVQFKF